MTQTHDPIPNDGNQRPWGDDLGAQLRALADGELNASDRRLLDQRLEASGQSAEAETRTGFEQGLRGAVGRAMLSQSPAAPAGLRDRILTAMREAPAHEFESEEPIRIAPSKAAPWGLLAAAAIVLTVGATLLMRAGWGSFPSSPSPIGAGTAAASVISAEDATHLVTFVTRQHDSCAVFGEKFNRKMVARTEAEAARAAIELLSRVPSVLELGSERLAAGGYEFAGLGRCHVPGDGRSAHLLYKSKLQGGPAVSLFVQEDTGSLALAPDRFYSCDQAEEIGTTLSVWRKDGLIYFLFTPDVEHAPGARELFGAPLLHGKLS